MAKAPSVAAKRFKQLYSIKNLQLAWDRVYANTEDMSYKSLYRDLFTYYDYDIKSHLQRISYKLKNLSFSPSKSFKYFKPKQSGLQRMFSLLDIDDLIVYQAIANIIIPTFAEKREKFEKKTVFSHILNKNENKDIFLFEKWKSGYQSYKRNIAKNYNAGLKFTAHFDLAAYYDTIDHTSLLNNFFKESENGIRRTLNDCLECWSNCSDDSFKMIHHGIPQGPLSSSIFGELYLLPIDEFLSKKNITYSRYVDDFVIQGKTLEEVQYAIVQLEIKCKERGLIPQVGKFEITESKTVEDAIGKAPSLSSQEQEYVFNVPEETLNLFRDSFKDESFDSSKIRYILKVYQESNILLDTIFLEFRKHYEFAEEFCIYLKRFLSDDNGRIEDFIKKQLRTTIPYEYVECQLWLVLAEIAKNTNLSYFAEHALIRLKTCKAFTRYGIYAFLASLNGNQFSGFLSYENDCLMMMVVIPFISAQVIERNSFEEILKYYSKRNNDSLQSILSRHLYTLRLFHDISKEQYDECLKFLPAIDESKYETINYYLKEDFGISTRIRWNQFFGDANQQASILLYSAHRNQDKNKTFWLNCIDSFNDLMVRGFIEYLKKNDAHIRLPDLFESNGSLADYGTLVNPKSKFSQRYKMIVSNLQKIHNRRCSTPLSHPQDKKSKAYSEFVKPTEYKTYFYLEVKTLQEIIDCVNFFCKINNS